MRTILPKLLLAFSAAVIVSAAAPASLAQGKRLTIPDIRQSSPTRSWVAVGQMLFEYRRLPRVNPDYQCGIVETLAKAAGDRSCAQNCRDCAPAGDGSREVIESMIRIYPPAAGGGQSAAIGVRHVPRALTAVEIKKEIQNERPIIASISPEGFPESLAGGRQVPQHAVLITGYVLQSTGFKLHVNDPYPYPARDPYTAQGGAKIGEARYSVRLEAFTDNLRWQESFTSLKPADAGPDAVVILDEPGALEGAVSTLVDGAAAKFAPITGELEKVEGGMKTYRAKLRLEGLDCVVEKLDDADVPPTYRCQGLMSPARALALFNKFAETLQREYPDWKVDLFDREKRILLMSEGKGSREGFRTVQLMGGRPEAEQTLFSLEISSPGGAPGRPAPNP